MHEVLGEPDRNPNRDLGAYAVLAMAFHQSKERTQAEAALARALELGKTPLPPPGDPSFGDVWDDWVIGQALLAEARNLTAPREK
jgi:hypothetical protein